MTTQTWTTAVAHANDTDFRAWGSELSGKLSAGGLVQTADTGQINWSTVARPAAFTVGGYEIWRFDDALQGTAPIFMKIEYGTGTNAAYPQLWLTVGTGSNGAGTLTGSVSARNTVGRQASPNSGGFPSYLCVTAGHVGLVWKAGAAGAGVAMAFFVVSRTVDSGGAPDATGYVVYFGQLGATTVTAQSVRTASPATVFAATTVYSIVPGQVATSQVGSDVQIYAHFGISPSVWILPTLATVLLSEIPAFSVVSAALAGGAARDLLSIGSGVLPINIGTGPGTSATYGVAMLWE